MSIALLLLTLFAQSEPPSTAGGDEARISAGYEALEDERPEEAVRIFSEIIDAAGEPELENQARVGRAFVRLEWLNQPQLAVEDLEAVLQVGPRDLFALSLLATAYENSGDHEAARAVWERIGRSHAETWRSESLIEKFFDGFLVQSAVSWLPVSVGGPTISRLIAALWAAVVLSVLHAIVNVFLGRRQKREGHGTWRRLIGVAGAIAAMQTAPLLAVLVLAAANLPEIDDSTLLPSVWLIWLINWLALAQVMRAPVRVQRIKGPLPVVDDDRFLRRVAELSARMGLQTPVVRLLRSMGGELQAMAFAGGLPAPSLIVSDGILHRLEPDERDAIVGHELAHLKNWSIWFLVGAWPLAAMSAVVAAALLSPGIGLAIGLAAHAGVYRLVSRHFEYDCDRRAAGVIGFRATVSALAKIHAAHFVRNKGWFSYLVYATATHPSRSERLAALHAAAPDHDKPDVVWNAREVSRRRTAARLAVIVWLILLVGLPWLSRQYPGSSLPAYLLGGVALFPSGLLIVGYLHKMRHALRRRKSRRRSWGWSLGIGLLVSFTIVVVIQIASGRTFAEDLDRLQSIPADILFFLVVILSTTTVLVAVLARLLPRFFGRTVKCEHAVAAAVFERDFARVQELARKWPRAFARSAPLRYSLAVSEALLGDRESAMDRLSRLRGDEPRFTDGSLALAMLHLEEERPQEALILCEELVQKLPKDPTPLLLRAWCLREQGRLDEAEAAVRRALDLEPESGTAYAVLSAIECDRGNTNVAAELLGQAEQHEPGTAFIQYIRAEQAARANDPNKARYEIDRAIAASDANPFTLLQKRVQRLSQRVEAELARTPPSTTA